MGGRGESCTIDDSVISRATNTSVCIMVCFPILITPPHYHLDSGERISRSMMHEPFLMNVCLMISAVLPFSLWLACGSEGAAH